MKNLHYKSWTGLILIVLGIVALVVSHTIREDVGEQIGEVRVVTKPLSGSGRSGKWVGGVTETRASNEASDYLNSATVLLVGGIILIVLGGWVVIKKQLWKK